MRYISWIIPDSLAARPGPKEVPWDLHELKANNIRAIISLSDEGAKEEIERHGFLNFQFYTEGLALTNELQIQQFVITVSPAIKIIHDNLSKGNKVLVHCHAGKDRTGFVIAAYLMKHLDYCAKDSLTYIRKHRNFCSYPGYENAVYYFEKNKSQF